MADWPPVIDADGHVLERQSDIRKYLEPPWNRRNTGLWPSDQPFDTDLFDTLGYPGYGRNMSPAQQVETWLKIMDEHNIEQAVLFPTGSGNIPKLREPEFCLAACRAANDHFAKEYNALSDRIHCVGVLPLKWPQEAAKELRRAVTELGLVSFELLSMGLPPRSAIRCTTRSTKRRSGSTCRSPSTATAALQPRSAPARLEPSPRCTATRFPSASFCTSPA